MPHSLMCLARTVLVYSGHVNIEMPHSMMSLALVRLVLVHSGHVY